MLDRTALRRAYRPEEDAIVAERLGEAAPLTAPLPPLPEGAIPESRNAPCPCGSGRKFKHCHGALA